MIKTFKSIVLVCLLLSGCKSSVFEPELQSLGYTYFPLEVGNYVSYNVTETIYRVNTSPEVLTYQVRELVESTFDDLNHGKSFRLVRYRRGNGRENWQVEKIWTARKNQQASVRVEENTPFVKLIFPLAEDKKWNGNNLNNLGEETYIMRFLHQPSRLTNKIYDSTLTVLHVADSNLVRKDSRYEIYANRIGLARRYAQQVWYCQTPACFGKAIIESGKTYNQTIFEFGKLP